MQKVFYKIKYKNFNGQDSESIHTSIDGTKNFANTLNNTTGISDVRIYIVNETEEELSFNQLFNNIKSGD